MRSRDQVGEGGRETRSTPSELEGSAVPIPPVPISPVEPEGLGPMALGAARGGARASGGFRLPQGGPLREDPQGRISNTRLNGVWAARRNRVKPPAVATARIDFSVAWAPKVGPPGSLFEAGVQIIVEAL